MCGLVGMAGLIMRPEKQAFRMLLILDSIRGIHSTGVASVIAKTNNIHLYKRVGNPYDLFNNDEKFSDNFTGIYAGDPKLLLGHNRYATMGKIIARNAHPFRDGDIVGAHNGTLNNWNLDKLEDHKDFEVDSEAIFHTIAKVGREEMLKRIDGAWALTWYDKKEQELNFIRNKERPLFYTWSDDHKTIFWASEEWMLFIALSKYGIKHGDVVSFKEHKLYTLPLIDEESLKEKELDEHPETFKGFIRPVWTAPVAPKWDKVFTHKNTNTGGKTTNSNVLPFRHPFKDAAFTVTSKEQNEYKGKKINFYIGSMKTSENGVKYLTCFTNDRNITYNIRLYFEGNERAQEWINSHGDYTANIKQLSVPERGPPYILLDMRTISKPTFNPTFSNMKDERAKGFMDEELTYEQFQLKTSNGCGYCGVDLLWDDRDSIIWCDDHTPIGPCCTSDPVNYQNVRDMYDIPVFKKD